MDFLYTKKHMIGSPKEPKRQADLENLTIKLWLLRLWRIGNSPDGGQRQDVSGAKNAPAKRPEVSFLAHLCKDPIVKKSLYAAGMLAAVTGVAVLAAVDGIIDGREQSHHIAVARETAIAEGHPNPVEACREKVMRDLGEALSDNSGADTYMAPMANQK